MFRRKFNIVFYYKIDHFDAIFKYKTLSKNWNFRCESKINFYSKFRHTLKKSLKIIFHPTNEGQNT